MSDSNVPVSGDSQSPSRPVSPPIPEDWNDVVISAVMPVYNEERMIEGCLESLDFCDERVVVDSFSDDATVERAMPLADRIYQRSFLAYGDQKNWGLSQLTTPWALVLDADGFLRAALLDSGPTNPYPYCHRPLIATRTDTPLGGLLRGFEARKTRTGDAIIDHDIILVWTEHPRILTGADVLGRLMHGIARHASTQRADADGAR